MAGLELIFFGIFEECTRKGDSRVNVKYYTATDPFS